jgi:hypothetical protein
MSDLPPLTQEPDAGSPPLPAGAQLIFAQARHMKKAGGLTSDTTVHWEATGPMDEAAMCRAMDTLGRSRDYLGLRLETKDGTGVLVPAEPGPVRVKAVAPEALSREMAAWNTRHDASGLPACALRLIRLEKERYAICFSGPHDFLDIWTIDQTLSALAPLYNAALDNRPAMLEKTPGFRDFAAWYDRLVSSGHLDIARDFWKDLLDGTAPVFSSPPSPESDFDHPMAAVQSALPLDPDLCRNFEARTRAEGGSTFEGYFTLFNLALARITGKQDLLSAFVASLRRVPGLADVGGCLLNRFYIPVSLAGKKDFSAVLHQVSGILASAKTHCLWPAWKDVDPEGTGYPGLFFHFVPPARDQGPEFKNLSVSRFTLVTPAHWPHPMAFQVMADPKQPMLFAIGQAGFCSADWLQGVQKTFAEIMAEV